MKIRSIVIQCKIAATLNRHVHFVYTVRKIRGVKQKKKKETAFQIRIDRYTEQSAIFMRLSGFSHKFARANTPRVFVKSIFVGLMHVTRFQNVRFIRTLHFEFGLQGFHNYKETYTLACREKNSEHFSQVINYNSFQVSMYSIYLEFKS